MSESKVECKAVKCDCCLMSDDVMDKLSNLNKEYYKGSTTIVISLKEVDSMGINVNEFAEKLSENINKVLMGKRKLY